MEKHLSKFLQSLWEVYASPTKHWVLTEFTVPFSIISIMLSQAKTKGIFNCFSPKDIIPQREKSGHIYQKEDNLKNDLQKEATVLGAIQILSCLMISSLGAILVSASYSFSFNPEVSTILMSGYPFVGSLCFVIAGSLSIISGKKSTNAFATSSLISNAVSSVAAGVGLILLGDSLIALRTASQQCDSEDLSSLPYSDYYYSTYETKDCLLASTSLTGLLVVMLIFTVLELLLAVYASHLWWKQVRPISSGVSMLTCQMIPAVPLGLSYDDPDTRRGRKMCQLFDHVEGDFYNGEWVG